MTNQELAAATRKALEEFRRLPPEQQIKRLMASGTINEQGEVLMGGHAPFGAEAEVFKAGEANSKPQQADSHDTHH